VKYVVTADGSINRRSSRGISKHLELQFHKKWLLRTPDVRELCKRRKKTTATTIADRSFKDKATFDYSLVKVGDVVTVNTKGLFEDD
jgi:trigger factor